MKKFLVVHHSEANTAKHVGVFEADCSERAELQAKHAWHLRRDTYPPVNVVAYEFEDLYPGWNVSI